jgi:hypothetical protein
MRKFKTDKEYLFTDKAYLFEVSKLLRETRTQKLINGLYVDTDCITMSKDLRNVLSEEIFKIAKRMKKQNLLLCKLGIHRKRFATDPCSEIICTRCLKEFSPSIKWPNYVKKSPGRSCQ